MSGHAPLDPIERREELDHAIRVTLGTTVAALALPVVVIALLIGVVLSWPLGLVVLVVGGIAAWLWIAARRRGAIDAALAALGARPLRPGEYPGYPNLLDGLSMTSGVDVPELYVVDTAAMNAAALAMDDRTAVAVTSGLLDAVDRLQLEAVLAQQVAHLQGGDAEASTAAFAFRTSLGVHAGVEELLPDRREELADLNALDLTRYPPALIAALELIERNGAGAPCTDAARHFWFVAPEPAAADNTVQVGVPERLGLLHEL